ncbi:TPA: helix-turn-helix transcriptional regulator [Enterococcus faecalis]|uniref:winged helix-turn-helix transcriptional regulator n=1 Tax=Enterococcus TaxID=1350 RepID=UPI000668B4AD|nr:MULTISPECIES: helix-turn-helix domain-containing protein [Enterococcus]MBD9867019.1 helix-turn-helix transcriptional regulator [Enterococcus faecalis]MDK7765392.1 helix-turn-helix domain-containing protein [Enterococcus faecalis]MDN6561622.1 helix-turn-helix transcriptional regulator [Enterococcus sp.]MDN6776496.1 helix-turn-helix transcriptional regulator [Enterococcus sp.]MDV2517209.1 helix-turn-helix domain-containing protein [Enterococcus faecalis]
MEKICPSTQPAFVQALSIINGKWKLKIIYELACTEVLRYGQLKRRLCKVTHKMLSSQLKELEKDGMILRKEYPQVPPKVEYSLSKKGLKFLPVLDELCSFGEEISTQIF